MSRNAWSALGVTLGVALAIGWSPESRDTYIFSAGALWGAWWLVFTEWFVYRGARR